MLKFLKSLLGPSAVEQPPKSLAAAFESPSDHADKPSVATASLSDDAPAAGSMDVVAKDEPLNVAPVAHQPAAKSQAQQDAELIASQAWVDAVSRGEQDWAVSMEALLGAVRSAQDEGRSVPLMMLSQYFWLNTPMPELGTSKLIDELRDRIEKDLSVNSYRAYIENKTKTRWSSYPHSVDFYLGEYVQVRASYLDGLRSLFENIPTCVSLVEEHYDTLSAAEREHRPSAGGDNLLRFKAFLSKYAQEHLPGVTPLDFFPASSPRYIRDHFQSDINTSGYLLLWALMGCVQVSRTASSQASTSQIGIEFEKQLIAEIAEEFPTARIEPTPVTGDQGADVILVLSGVKIVIQAKKYTGVVGNAAVQEVFAAMQFYDADYAMVVTNSRYTVAAQTLATKIGVELTTAGDYLRRIEQLLV